MVSLFLELTILVSVVARLFAYDIWVWVSQDLVFCVASQCSFAFRLELPNHLALTPSQDATQSICAISQMSFINWFFSGREAFLHIRNFQLSLGHQLRMRLLLVSGDRPKNQLTSGLLDWKLIVEICVWPWPLTGVLRISYGTQSGFPPNSLWWGYWYFWTSSRHHHSWESGSSVFRLLPWVGWEFPDFFQTDLQTIQIFLISHQKHRFREGFGQFRCSVNVIFEIVRITLTCQLLKGQQNLVCFSWRRSVLTAKLWLTCEARLLLFSWRSSKGALGKIFLKSCHHVRDLIRIWVS